MKYIKPFKLFENISTDNEFTSVIKSANEVEITKLSENLEKYKTFFTKWKTLLELALDFRPIKISNAATDITNFISWLDGNEIDNLPKVFLKVFYTIGYTDGIYYYPPKIAYPQQEYENILNILITEKGLLYKIIPNDYFVCFRLNISYVKVMLNMETLRNVKVTGTVAITNCSVAFKNLSWIPDCKMLFIESCNGFKNLEGCPVIKELIIRKCGFLSLEGVNQNVEQIIIENCSKFASLKGAPNVLSKLSIIQCNNFISLEYCPSQVDVLWVYGYSVRSGIQSLHLPDKITLNTILQYNSEFLNQKGKYPHTIQNDIYNNRLVNHSAGIVKVFDQYAKWKLKI